MLYSFIQNAINQSRINKDYENKTGRKIYTADSGQQYISKFGEEYNDKYYNSLIQKRDYDTAVRYLKGFDFIDREYNADYKAEIASLQQEGTRYKALAGTLDDNQLQAYDFIENVYNPGAFDNLQGNSYVKKFEDFKYKLGSRLSTPDHANKHIDMRIRGKYMFSSEVQNVDVYADRLRFTFDKDKNSLDSFLSSAGLDYNDLEKNGVIKTTRDSKDGLDYIEFDKSNPLANKLIVSYWKKQNDDYSLFSSSTGMIQGLSSNNRGGYNVVDEISWNEYTYKPTKEYADFLNNKNPTYGMLHYLTSDIDDMRPRYVDKDTAIKENNRILKEHQDELQFYDGSQTMDVLSNPNLSWNDKQKLLTGRRLIYANDEDRLRNAMNADEILNKYHGYAQSSPEIDLEDEDRHVLGERGASILGDYDRAKYGAENIAYTQGDKLNYFGSMLAETIGEGEDLLTKINDTKEFEDLNKEYTSVIGGELSDGTEELRELHEKGLIDDSTYYKQMALMPKSLVKRLKSMDLQLEEEAYTNINNEQGDRTLVEATPDDLAEISRRISNAADGDLILQAMVSNGKIGTLITLKSEYKNADKKDKLLDPVQLFVPKLFLNEAQNKLNRDTSSRATVEVNNIIESNGTYTLEDGNTIVANSRGELTMNEYDNRGNLRNSYAIDKESAVHTINASLLKEGLTEGLLNKYVNSDGAIVYKDMFEQEARVHIKAAADELYPDVPLIKSNGQPYTDDELFHHKIRQEDVPSYMWDKIKQIYNLYDGIMTNASLYTR